jgi:hypothetical protein
MYNGEETFWINQKEFQHKDVEFNSASTIDISTSLNTKDFKYYSQVTLNLSITSDSDRSRRSCNLNLNDARKLLGSFIEVSRDYKLVYEREEPLKISNKYGNKYLEFMYKLSRTQIRCVVITIIHSENDYGQIVVPLEEFETIVHIFSNFRHSYHIYRKELKDQIVNCKLIENISSMERAIKTLPSAISATPTELPSLDIETQIETSDAQTDFEKYVKDESVLETPLPEEKKIEQDQVEPLPEITSDFITNTLKLDMGNYERLLAAASGEYNTTEAIIERLKESIKQPEEYEFLPGISENDYKSSLYISRFNYLAAFKLYSRDKVQIPVSVPPIKYKPDKSKVHDLNVEIAYDLLTISAFVKCMIQKLGQKIGDSQTNKSLFYFAHRCFTDILCFSFLTDVEGDIVKNCIMTRFRDYSKVGFFKQYQDLLHVSTCNPVSEQDIQSFLDQLVDKVLPADLYVSNLHHKLYEDKLLLPATNKVSLEQITNEVVKINVLHFVEELNVYEIDLAQLNQIVNMQVPPELFDILRAPKSLRKQVEKIKYTSNLHFYFNKYQGDLPKGKEKELVEYFEKLGEEDFPFDNPPVNLEDLEEKYIRALYHHNSLKKGERNLKRNDFNAYIHEECTMTKRNILDIYKAKEEDKDSKEGIVEDFEAALKVIDG